MSGSTVLKAISAWGCDPCAGKPLPDWVKALAEACDDASLRKVAAKLDVSPAIISLAVNKRRDREKLEFIKIRVERTLMVTMVACPVLGVMGREECLREQARGFSSANPHRVQIYRACRNGCPHFRNREKKA